MLYEVITDRLVHSAHKIRLAASESMRKSSARRSDKASSPTKEID